MVEQSRIEVAVLSDLFTGEESQCADAVVEFDKDNVARGLLDETRLIEIDPCIICEAPARYPNPNR